MAPMRELVFGLMPEGATPGSHIAAGPWCFAGREELFPGWDEPPAPGALAFALPPDPYSNGEAAAEAARAANAEALRLARSLGPGLFSDIGGKSLSGRFFDMALGPFMLLATHMLAERQKRVQDLAALYGHEPLQVELLPDALPFSFRDCEDFKKNATHDSTFNHYAYSRIVECLAPPSWRLRYAGSAPVLHSAQTRSHEDLKKRCRLFLRRRLRNLPFPRYKGFALWQSLALSLAVLLNKRGKPDRSIDFSAYASEPLRWLFPAEKLIAACIPLALRERPACLRSAGSSRPPQKPGPLRGMTAAYMEDDAYRLRLACMRERGFRLFSVQHGANYGNLLSLGSIPFEYSQHLFFTWGWSGQQGFAANARPMPHPALCAIAGKHREKSPELILVGAEMSSYAYRLKSRPQAGALPEYRRGKLAFLRHMQDFFDSRSGAASLAKGKDAKAGLLYRPYFSLPGGLDDGAYVLRHMPGMRLCTGDLTARMLSCRLLALDHYGTTLHMALAADAPCLAYWDRQAWAMDPGSDKAFDCLRDAGLLLESPEAAARKAEAVWDDVQGWWRSSEVQGARRLWLDSYARIGDTSDKPLDALALTRQWFKALRNA